MLNTVVKRLFAFNCAIYSLPYTFYLKFTQSLPNILPSFSSDSYIRKRNLKSWFEYPWKDFDKEKLKRGPGKEQWTMNCFINKEQKQKCKYDFPVYEHNIFLISGTFSCPYIRIGLFFRAPRSTKVDVTSSCSSDCPGPSRTVRFWVTIQ